MRRISCTLAALAALAAPALPSDAAAATVTVEQTLCSRSGCLYTVFVRAAAGERNEIAIGASEAGPDRRTVRVADAGAPLDAGAGCAQDGEHAATCTLSRYSDVRAELGDGDDRLVADAAVTADGGAGDDVLEGRGPDGSALGGGGGRDVLRGGPGHDRLGDGDGGEVPVDADVLAAGGGRDVLDMARRTEGVVFAPGRPTAGQPGENDAVSGFEGAAGGSGDDVLRAAPGGALLSGGAGDDRLAGGDGADAVLGGAGDDRLRGGGGNDGFRPGTGADRMDGGDGSDVFDLELVGGPPDDPGDRVTCGGGLRDDAAGVRAVDLVGSDCERVWPQSILQDSAGLHALLGDPRAAFVTHQVDCPPRHCRIAMSARVDPRRAPRGVRPWRLVAERPAQPLRTRRRFPRIGLRLSASGARLLRRHRRLPVVVRICEGTGEPSCGGFRTTLVLAR